MGQLTGFMLLEPGRKRRQSATYLSRDFLTAEEQRALAWLLKHRSHVGGLRVSLRTGNTCLEVVRRMLTRFLASSKWTWVESEDSCRRSYAVVDRAGNFSFAGVGAR